MLLLFLSCLIINVLTLYNGHNWGGDFAQYLIHAQNLINHKPYTQGIMLEKTIVYPPGFPLLLAPLVKLFGLNFIYLKCLNIFFWAGSTFFIYMLAKDLADKSFALLCALFLCSSSVFFTFKQNILSDIPFMFFTLACLFFLTHRQWLLAFILIYFSILVRSAGLALALSAICYFIFFNRQWKIACGIALAVALSIISQSIICGHLYPAFFNTLIRSFPSWATVINFSPTTWQSIAWFYVPGQTTFTSFLFLLASWACVILSPALWVGLAYLGYFKARHKNATLIDCFVFAYMALLLCWSLFGDSPQNFIRFLCPIIGLLPIIAYTTLKKITCQLWLKWALIACIMSNTINIAVIFHFNDDEIVSNKKNQELFGWIRTNVNDGQSFMMWEPRTATLMTHKVGTTLAWIAQSPVQQWHQILKNMGVRYCIFNKEKDIPFIQRALQQTSGLKLRFENAQYVIFETSP